MNGGTHSERVLTLLDLGRWDEALDLARRGLAENPADPHRWCLVSLAHFRHAQFALALAAAERAAGLGGADPSWPHRLRAESLRALGRAREAVDAARFGAAVDPNFWRAHISVASAVLAYATYGGANRRPGALGWIAALRDPYSEAAAAAERALELAPTEPDAMLALADVRRRQQRAKDVRALADRALATAPADPEVLRRHTKLVDSPGLLARSARGFARAAALDPRSYATVEFGRVIRRAALWGLLLLVGTWALLSSLMDRVAPDPESPALLGAAAAVEAACLMALAAPLLVLLLRLEPSQRRPALRSLGRRRALLVVVGVSALVPIPLELSGSDYERPAVGVFAAVLYVGVVGSGVLAVRAIRRIRGGSRG